LKYLDGRRTVGMTADVNIRIRATVDTVKNIVRAEATDHIDSFLQVISDIELQPIRLLRGEYHVQELNDAEHNLQKTTERNTSDMIAKVSPNRGEEI
jgi:hypothetical protein